MTTLEQLEFCLKKDVVVLLYYKDKFISQFKGELAKGYDDDYHVRSNDGHSVLIIDPKTIKTIVNHYLSKPTITVELL